ncbi:MAG: type II secretion system secretin GspD [Deltaproteobacteria bacterium]|nr:type II secretion system secretin GspD [Deltaproteobacteria bacterium]
MCERVTNRLCYYWRLKRRVRFNILSGGRGFLAMLLTALCLFAVAGATVAADPAGAAEAGRGGRSSQDEVSINFVDVDIATFIKFISEVTGKNFIYDNRVKGKVTIIVPRKLTIDETFTLFTSILEIKGFTIVSTEHAYKVIPAAMARQSGAEVVTSIEERVRVDDTYIVRLIPLNFISGQEVIPFLRPLISKNGYLSLFGPKNTLLVADTARNIDKLLEIVAIVDSGGEYEEFEIVYLRYAQAEVISQVLHEMAPRLGGGTAGQQRGQPGKSSSVGKIRIIPDTRLNAIILVGPRDQRARLKGSIVSLDVPSPATSSNINVYYLENADVLELAKVLEGLVKTTGARRAQGGTAASPTEFSGEIRITPDKATNALVVIATPTDYQSLVQVIKKLDRRPRQVFVEAMITEVSIDKALDLGTKWRMVGTQEGKPVVIGGVGKVDASTLSSIMTGLAGLTVGGLANFLTVPITLPDGSTSDLTVPGFAALFRLAEFRDVVNVLSTPHILTSNNKEAEIIIGENVPFLSKLEREATTTGQPLIQSIEREDVGITLRITPQISEGNYVKLDIFQEISAIATTTVEAADIITTKRSARTSVVVKDRQTAVIGGLIQEVETINITKVPLLGDIPILGWLFKFKTKKKQKKNLLVFITPYIVRDFEELDRLKRRKEEEYEKGTGEKGKKVRPTEGERESRKEEPHEESQPRSIEPVVMKGVVAEQSAPETEEEVDNERAPHDGIEVQVNGAPSIAEVEAPPAMPVKGDRIVGIKAESGGGETVVTIVGNGAPGSYNSFRLDSPDRLVIDIWGVKNSLHERSIDVNEGVVKRVRIGDHPDKSRIVIDFSGDNVPHHSIDKVGNALMVTFSGGDGVGTDEE